MNEVNARSVPVYGGHQGQFRKVHKADWETVCVNGIPQIYATSADAEVAAWRAPRSHLCGDIVGTGEKASIAKAKGEFAKIFPGKGRRPVDVERR